MDNLGFALEGAWKVLVAGLILGAGLPALFAVGVRSLAYGAGQDVSAGTVEEPKQGRPIGTVVAVICFTLVLAFVALGITFIIASGFGKALSFDQGYPTIVEKE